MLSPAEQHKQQVQASMASAAGQSEAVKHPLDRTMRYKLGSDRARLKKIASMQRKAEVKAEIVPEYRLYLQGMMAAGAGDELLTQVMVWALDAGLLETFSLLARYALDNGVAMPTDFARPLGAWLAESTAKLVLRKLEAGEGIPAELHDLAMWVEAETTQMDMHDEIRAKLRRACGELTEDAAQALALLESALALDPHIRVKKRIAALKEQLAELNGSQPPQGQSADGSGSPGVTPSPATVGNSAAAPADLDAKEQAHARNG